MQETLIQIKNEAMSMIVSAQSDEIEDIYIAFLGKKGKLTIAMKELPKLPQEERGEIGKLANEIKNTLEEQINDKRKSLKKAKFQPSNSSEESSKQYSKTNLDITLPGKKPVVGSLHLVTQAIEEITSIFERIGFVKVRYPEVEYDWYAFEALNFPDNHPARDDWETFFVELEADSRKGPVLLTPHTSSGQIRELEKGREAEVSE
jgi:phenylalanyl-tRNA synthetase alpha chain